MAKEKTLGLYNLAAFGVDVDSDNLHVQPGSFRTTQNLRRSFVSAQDGSVVSRFGLRSLNSVALGAGAILGGVAVPVFELGDGTETLLVGFGD